MTTQSFTDVQTILNGVEILQDILNKMRRHSLEMAVNTLSRRSMQGDFEDVQRAATWISDAAQRLSAMCAEACADLPLADPRRSGGNLS